MLVPSIPTSGLCAISGGALYIRIKNNICASLSQVMRLFYLYRLEAPHHNRLNLTFYNIRAMCMMHGTCPIITAFVHPCGWVLQCRVHPLGVE